MYLFSVTLPHATSPPHPFPFTPSSSGDIDDALRSSTVAESLLISLGRRPNATGGTAGHQCQPSLRRPAGHQLGLSHILQTDGIVLSGGECAYQESPRDLARIRCVV